MEEQRDYYLKLYEKWAKWQREAPEKLPIGFRTKEEFDFEKVIEFFVELAPELENHGFFYEAYNRKFTNVFWQSNYFNIVQSAFYKLCSFDYEVDQILIFLFENSTIIHDLVISDKNLILGDARTDNNQLLLRRISGNLHFINKSQIRFPKLFFQNCTFSHITLENFDRGYFSPETNDYLNQMENEGKLTLINCTWSGLPVVNTEKEEQAEKVFEFEEIIPEEYKDAFAQYFMGFKNFLLRSKGKKVGIEVNLNGKLQLKIYSDRKEDIQNTEQDFKEFIANIVEVIKTGKVNVTFANSRLAENGHYLMANMINQINALKASLSFVQLENKTLEGQVKYQDKQILSLENLIENQVSKIITLEATNQNLEKENSDLSEKIDTLRQKLRDIRTENIGYSDKIDILIGLMSELNLAIQDKTEITLTKKAINNIADFTKLNENWLKMLPKILPFLKLIVEESRKRF